MPDQYCVILTSVASREEAETLAELLVAGRLSACVQVIAVSSMYTWKGELHREPEHLLLIKTRTDRYEAVEAAIRENHSYELPEIIQLPVERGLPAYLEWISENSGT